MNKKKILIVHNYYQIPGGEDTVVASEKQMLTDHGHEVVFYSKTNADLRKMGKIQKLLLPINTIFNFKTYKEIRRLIQQARIDIVHVHNTLNLISPSVYYAARSCKIPVVQTVHNFRLLCPGAVFYRNGHVCEDCVKKGLLCAVRHRCYRNSRIQTLACMLNLKFHRLTGIYKKINYICLTEFNKEKLLTQKQIEPERIFVKPNFIEGGNEIVPASQRNNQFVFAGRLDELKGVKIMFEAWRKMGNNAPMLFVCGKGPLEKWCTDFIRENKLTMIKMLGFIPNVEVRKIVAISKGILLPTQWYEGFPMSIIEAFSVGTPVVCSALGNAGNIVTEGITGTKFECTSVTELILALKRLSYSKHIHETTINEYLKKYTQLENYKKLNWIYENLR